MPSIKRAYDAVYSFGSEQKHHSTASLSREGGARAAAAAAAAHAPERDRASEREFIRNDTRANEGAEGAGEGACGHVQLEKSGKHAVGVRDDGAGSRLPHAVARGAGGGATRSRCRRW